MGGKDWEGTGVTSEVSTSPHVVTGMRCDNRNRGAECERANMKQLHLAPVVWCEKTEGGINVVGDFSACGPVSRAGPWI